MRVPPQPQTPDRTGLSANPHAPRPFISTPERTESPSLGGSWIPIGSVGDTDNVTESEMTDSYLHDEPPEDDEDDLSSIDLSSSIELSVDGSTTGTRSPIDDSESGIHTPESIASSRLLGEYVDAEAPSTRLEDSTPQVELVYPYPLESSFASSLTASDTTPTGSVGSLQRSTDSVVGPRSSRYRLEGRPGETVIRGPGARRTLLDEGSLGSTSVRLSNDRIVNGNQSPSTNSTKTSSRSSSGLQAAPMKGHVQGLDGSSAQGEEDEKETASDRLLGTAKCIRQKWSLRMSLIALTSIVSIAVATVQYAPITGTTESTRAPIVPTPKGFSIMDYLPLQIHSLPEPVVTLSNSGASSYMPDVRLIKNALSLSTKSNALAPAEQQSTAKGVKVQSQETHTAKSVGPTSYSLSLRNTDVALTTLIDASTKWHRSLRGLGRGQTDAVTNDKGRRGNWTGYDKVTRAGLKSATFDAISEGRMLDVFYYVHLQFIALLRSEIDVAMALGRSMVGWGINTTRSTGSQVIVGASYLRQHIATGFHDLATHIHSIRLINAEEARAVSQKARSSLDNMSERALMTSKWGTECIYQARAGLDYLIAEGKRRRSSLISDHQGEARKQVEVPKRVTTRRDGRTQCGRLRRSRWNRRQASCGGVAIPPPAEQARQVQDKGGKMSWAQKAYRALHDAAPAFIV